MPPPRSFLSFSFSFFFSFSSRYPCGQNAPLVLPRSGGGADGSKSYYVNHRAAASIYRAHMAEFLGPKLQFHQERKWPNAARDGGEGTMLSFMETLGNKQFKATLRHTAPHLPVYKAFFTDGAVSMDPAI